MKQLLNNPKQLLYITCFFFMCAVDQRKGSVTGNMQYFWSNCTGFAVALLILSHYRIRDFVKKPYLVWTVIGFGGVAAGMILPHKVQLPWPNEQWYSAIANIFLYGFLVIRIVTDIWGKSFDKKRYLFPGFLCLMLFLMGISRNDSVWPWYFLMVFGSFSLIDFSETERRNILFAFADGTILSFVCIQGLAFVFRPYDEIRYLGLYVNPNINALFYSVVYCAILMRLLYFLFEYTGRFKKLLGGLFLFLGGAMWSFCMLTGCRTAIFSMGAVTCIAGIVSLLQFRRMVFVKGIAMVLGLLLCIIVSFPVVYGCVRYIPAFFHHPIWFFVEYSEDKVHSYDPIDSEKYIDFNEITEYIQERLFGISISDHDSQVWNDGRYRFALMCSASDAIYEQKPREPLIPKTEDSGEIRYHIYKYYLSKLNMTGHLSGDNGIYITEDYMAPHAHNLYLQLAFDFGVPIGVLFIGYILMSILLLGKNALREKTSYCVYPLLLIVNSCVFGMLEMMWVNGFIAFSVLFFTPLLAVRGFESINK